MNKEKIFTASAQITIKLKRLLRKNIAQTVMEGLQCFVICAILARGTLFGLYSPFAVAMVAALSVTGSMVYGGLGAIFGYLVLRNDLAGIGCVGAVMIVMVCHNIFMDFKIRTNQWFMPLVSTFSMAAAGFVFVETLDARNIILFVCAVVLTFVMSYFYLIAFSPPKTQSDITKPTAVVVFIASIILSLSDITFFTMAPARIFATLITMGAGFTLGSTGGTAVGMAFGMLMDAGIGENVFFTCTYGFGPLIAGAFRKTGKVSYGIIYLFSSVCASLLLIDNSMFFSVLTEIAFASIIFISIPNSTWRYVREIIVPQPKDTEQAMLRMRQNIKKYTMDASQAIYEMYLGMSSGSGYGGAYEDAEMEGVFYEVTEIVCKRCALCSGCWEKNYVSTMDSLNKASISILKRGKAQASDFPKHFTSRCVKIPEFLRTLNEILFSTQQRREYRRKCEENRSLIAQQYSGLTEVIRQIGLGQTQDLSSLPGKERQVKRYTIAFGDIDKVAVYRDGNHHLRIELSGKDIHSIEKQQQGFTSGLCALLSMKLSLPEYISDELGERLLFREQAPFHAIVGIGQKQKAGETVCGDTGRYFVAEDGHACLMLFDGMGTGEGAAQDSRSVLRQMERFLRAGVLPCDALQTIAPAYRLKCDGKRFVTVDILRVDLFSGKAESLKCGAAPSYVKTKQGVTRILSNTLPMGIAQDDGESMQFRMLSGDLFVMLTDGITDGIDDEWVIELLEKHHNEPPKEIAAKLCNIASEQNENDDMSVFVMRINKV